MNLKTNLKTDRKNISVRFNSEIVDRKFLRVTETQLQWGEDERVHNSHEGRRGSMILKNVQRSVHEGKKEGILSVPKEKLLGGCNP